MRTADAIRMVEAARVTVNRALGAHAHVSRDALMKLENWIRAGALLEDVDGVDPRVDREKHSGKEDALAETGGMARAHHGDGGRARKGGPGPQGDGKLRPRITRTGRGEFGI